MVAEGDYGDRVNVMYDHTVTVSSKKIIVNNDKIDPAIANYNKPDSYLLCTEEQLKDTEYLLENGMMVLRAEQLYNIILSIHVKCILNMY